MGSRAANVLSVLVVAVTIASCSSSPATTSNPGLSFSGTYHVVQISKTVDGKAIESDTQTDEFDWVVQPVCEGDTGPCTAVANSTDPNGSSNINRNRTEFIYDDGTWSRVADSAPTEPCTNAKTGELIDEPFFGLDTTTFSADDQSAPATSFSGNRTAAITGTCRGLFDYTLTVTRTSDVPDDVPTPTGVQSVPAVVESHAADFTGTYTEKRRLISATGLTNSVPLDPYPTNEYRLRPVTCTRDGSVCIVSIGKGDIVNSLYIFRDGRFEASSVTDEELTCFTNPETGVNKFPRLTAVLDDIGKDVPISSLSGTETYESQNDSCGTLVNELEYERTGD